MSNLDNPLNHSFLKMMPPAVDMSEAFERRGSLRLDHVYNFLVIYISEAVNGRQNFSLSTSTHLGKDFNVM